MNRLRILILPMVIALFGMHCINGMESGHSAGLNRDLGGCSGSDEQNCLHDGKIGREEEKRSEILYLRGSDGIDVPVRKEIVTRLSLMIGIMSDVSNKSDVISVNIPGNVLGELARLMTEEYDLLQAGMPLREIKNRQRAAFAPLRDFSKLTHAAHFLGCELVSRAIHSPRQECLFDYFMSDILPLRLLDMTPETFDLVKIFDETSRKPRATQRVAIKALRDPELCRFYHKLPEGALKQEICAIISNSVILYAGNFSAMPVQLTATSCLLGLPFKSQILQAFGINEQWFNARVVSIIPSTLYGTLLRSSWHPGGMNAQQLGFVLECARLLKITDLDLSGNGIATLPAAIGQLKILEKLNVLRNNITTLPAEIGQLQDLWFLEVGWNRLGALPVEIGRLHKLVTLDVSHNQLTTLPVEIGLLLKLKWFMAPDNQLVTLPAEIGSMQALELLDVTDNSFATLPAEIGLLQELTDLKVAHNPFTTYPAGMGGHNRRLLRVDITETPCAVNSGCDYALFAGYAG